MKWRRRIEWIVLCPVFALATFNFWLTGAVIPLWHIERLESPCTVKSIGGSELELEDGRKVRLPFIKALPQNNPLFQTAISSGVEISPLGEAYGLMWVDRSCGNDAYVWRKIRVNLSDLAAALYPAGIDDSLIHPDAIAFIQEHKSIDLASPTASHQKLHLSDWDRIKMSWIRRQFEWSDANAGKTNSENHD